MSYWADSSYNKCYENLLSTLEKKRKTLLTSEDVILKINKKIWTEINLLFLFLSSGMLGFLQTQTKHILLPFKVVKVYQNDYLAYKYLHQHIYQYIDQ